MAGKPREQEYWAEIARLDRVIFAVNIPTVHHYKLARMQ